jgi:hypothetical protein
MLLVVAALDVVAAGVVGIESAGVARGVGDDPALAEDAPQRAPQGATHGFQSQQSSAGLLQGRVMRDALQAQDLAQVGAVEEELPDAAIIFPLVLLENQAGEQLRLGERLGAVFVGVVAKGVLAGGQRDHRHIPWRLAGGHVTSNTSAGSANSGVRRGFLQSHVHCLSSPNDRTIKAAHGRRMRMSHRAPPHRRDGHRSARFGPGP